MRWDCWSTASRQHNLLGIDHSLGAVVERHFDRVGGQKLCPAGHILNLVVGKVALVDTVQTFDVSVSLDLKGAPVKRGRLGDAEAVRLGLVNGLGDGCGVKCDFLGNTARNDCQRLGSAVGRNARSDLPNIDACAS
jgi:hypothetical protein